MRANAQIEVRRCRPLLGTLVEIQAFGTSDLEGAIEEAFLAITPGGKTAPLLGCFTQRATRPARLNSIEGFSQTLALRRARAAPLFQRAAWAYWDDLVLPPGDFEMSAKAWAMEIHGAAAMAILLLVEMLLAGQVRAAFWRARRNRGNGSLFLSAFGILTITGYGLYYAGSESLRAWTSWIHLAVGFALPLLLMLSVWLGKWTSTTAQLRTRASSVVKLT